MLSLHQGLAKLQAGVVVLAPGFNLRPDALVIFHEQFHRGDVSRGQKGRGEGGSVEKKGTLGDGPV